MKKRRRRTRLSFGTVFMLLLTLAAVLGCAWFMMAITGGRMAEHAAKTIGAFSFAGEEPAMVYTATMTALPLQPAGTPSPIPSAQETPGETPAPEKTTITLAAAGTVYAPKAIRQTVAAENGEADFAPVFEPLTAVLGAADLTIATLETTTAGGEKGNGNYNAPPQLLDALRACGVDLISLGTERALDEGYDGLEITMQEITSRGLSYAGVRREEQGGVQAAMMRIGGVQVAVLAYSYGLSDEGADKTDGDSRGQLALLNTERMHSDIAAARTAGANLVVVLPHWGTKNKQATPEVVRTMAHGLAQAGADVILGTHPNVVQSVERISTVRADGLTYETVVCYSLGSLLTDAQTPENTAGMAVSLDVTYDPVTRRIALGGVEATPLYIARVKDSDRTVYRVVPAQDEEALALLDAAEQAAAQNAVRIVFEAMEQEEQP